MHGQLIAFVIGDDGARLHRVGDQAVVDDAELDHMRSRGQSAFGACAIAEFPVERQIAGDVIVNERLAGVGGCCSARRRWQALIVDFNQLGCVFRQNRRLGDDEGDMITHMTHAILAQNRPKRSLAFAAVAVLHRDRAGKLIGAMGRDVVSQDDGENAGSGRRGIDFDALDLRMRFR